MRRNVRSRCLLPLALLAELAAGLCAAGAQVLSPNLIYTTVEPCTVVDKPLAPGSYGFDVVGTGSLAAQGGSATGCAIPGRSGPRAQVQAVAVNIAVMNASLAGRLFAWPSGPPPLNPTMYFPAGSVGQIASEIILPLNQGTGSDFSIKLTRGLTLLVTVVGYLSSGSPVPMQPAGLNLFLGVDAGNPATTTAGTNTAIGDLALKADTRGDNNVAVGFDAMENNSTGDANAAAGFGALGANLTGNDNTALGAAALTANQSGDNNTAVGWEALMSNVSSANNTAVGYFALGSAIGTGNVALGVEAGSSITTGGENIAVGLLAGSGITAGSNNIDIGNTVSSNESGTIRIGDVQTSTYVAGIFSEPSPSGITVYVNSSGKLGTVPSSLRFKQDVQDMGDASDGLMQLHPVSFRYRPAYDDGSHLLQYGLIAEEVAKVYPDLVQYDRDGQPLAVRYHFVNAMLLNEVQKLHARAADQAQRLAEQDARIDRQQREIQDLKVRLARLEALLLAPPG
jgi:hypothetical protein